MTQEVSEVLFEHLFQEIVNHIVDHSNEDGSEEPDHEIAFYKIERLGFSMGQRLAERLLHRHMNTRMPDQLEVFKFICKEFWNAVFRRNIDNLKTNHRGVYLLQVADFPWSARFSPDAMSTDNAKLTILYLAYPCGLLRGALSNMGIDATVTAEIPAFPQCAFNVNVSSSLLPLTS